MYALCDCNNFFVSCERVFRPDLEGKPVVVLSNNDGCVVSRSNEAKKIGIPMGAPYFKIKELAKHCQITIFSSNMSLYRDLSERVHETLRSFIPEIEIYSIDEAFLNLDGIKNSELLPFGREIAHTVKKNTGIPISVGVSKTKTLAKIAAELCKTYPKLNGSCLMQRNEDIEKVLKKFPLADVWGIGRRYSRRFTDYGLHTAWDFFNLSQEWVRKEMGMSGVKTWLELHQKECIEFEDAVKNKKSICTSRSFTKEIYDFETLLQQTAIFVSMTADKLRKQHGVCGQLTVFAMGNRFTNTELKSYSSATHSFEVATDSTIEMTNVATSMLRSLFKPYFGYKKAGVIVYDISSKNNIQTALFDKVDHDKHTSLMAAIDDINSRDGQQTIVTARHGFGGIQNTHKHNSMRYTTDWNEIPIVTNL